MILLMEFFSAVETTPKNKFSTKSPTFFYLTLFTIYYILEIINIFYSILKSKSTLVDIILK